MATSPRKKTNDKSKLQEMRSVTITISASEGNLQRLAALLLFADHLEPEFKYEDRPLPWEDPNDPKFQQPPELQLDYNVVKRNVVKLLEQYLAKHGADNARKVIQSCGADRVSLLTEPQLLSLYEALTAALPADPEKES